MPRPPEPVSKEALDIILGPEPGKGPPPAREPAVEFPRFGVSPGRDGLQEPVFGPVPSGPFTFGDPQAPDPRFITPLPLVESEEERNRRLENERIQRGLPIQFTTPPGATLKDINDLLERQLSSGNIGPDSRIAQAFAEGAEPLEQLGREFAGLATTGVQRLVPGEQEAERRARELREQGIDTITAARRAFEETDFPSARVTAVPFGGIPLPGGRRLEQVDLGVKGAIRLAADPLILAPGVGFGGAIAKGGRAIAGAATRGARTAVRGPTIDFGGLLTTPAREAAQEVPEAAARVVSGTPETALAIPEQRALQAPTTAADRVEAAAQRLTEIAAEVESREVSGIVRPSWAVGITNEELAAVARQEGLNPFLPDWADAIDPVVIREVRQGFFRDPNAETLTSLRSQRTDARAELKTAQANLAEEPRVPSSRVDRVGESIETDVALTRLAAEGAGQAPPPRRPGTPQGVSDDLPQPRGPDVGLSDDLELPTHEVPQSGVMRKWEGARAAEGLAMEDWFSTGQKLTKRLGIREFNEKTMRPLFEALHGERPANTLSDELTELYIDLRSLALQEEEDMLAFLGQVQDQNSRTLMAFDAENLVNRFMAHPDYFPRGWKPAKSPRAQAGTTRGRLGVTPSLAKPRVDATFRELLESGLEPASWDPYAMMAMRRMAGVEYRESVKLINRLYQRGLALPRGEAPDGWRVPGVGPVFEGKPIPSTNVPGGTAFTRPIAVPNEVANFLESAFGVPANIPGLQTIKQWSTRAKRLKLVGSFFQHIDFGFRAAGVAASPTGIRQGAPLKFPSLMKDLLAVQWLPGSREALRGKLLSDAPIYKDFPISYKMLIEEGWGVQGDLSLIRREFSDFIAETAASIDRRAVPAEVLAKSIEPIRKAQQFFEAGLFDGVYRETQRWALQNFIIPWLRRSRPAATPRQIAGEAASTVNEMFSTLGLWQTVLKNPAIKDLAQTAMFSTNESEGLIRGALQAMSIPGTRGAIPGKASKFIPKAPQAGLFREWYLGLFISMAAIANVINMVATGKPLPLEAYRPIDIDDPYAPFKVGYNTRFLSPQIPFVSGRDGQPLYLDVVGQMDTAFRWALDPVSAGASRVNVLPRAILNQARGAGFFGNPLTSVAQRAAQAFSDVALPIGPGSAASALREQIPGGETLIPEAESRIGVTGGLLQAAGSNVRGERTSQLLDRVAEEMFGRSYDDLGPRDRDAVQKSPDVEAELQLRRETAVERGDVISTYFSERDKRIDQFQQTVAAAAEQLGPGRAFRRRLSTLQQERATRLDEVEKSNAEAIKQLGQREPREHRLDRALVAYFDALEEAKLEDPVTGDFDFAKRRTVLQALRKELGEDIIDEVESFIRRNEHPLVAQLRESREIARPYFEAREVMAQAMGQTEAFNEWVDSPDRLRFLDLHPRLKAAFREADRVKEELRRLHPEIERHLFAWGYVDRPISRDVRDMEAFLKQQGGGIVVDRSPLLPQPAEREPEPAIR